MSFCLPFGVRIRRCSLNLPITSKSVDDLGWIDGFFGQIQDYMFLRSEDYVLILPPNRVYKIMGVCT